MASFNTARSTIPRPNRQAAVLAYTDSNRVRRQTFPKIRFDTPMFDVEESIRLTLSYLAAGIRPYSGGKLVTLDDNYADTVIWPIVGTVQRRGYRNDTSLTDDDALIVELIHTRYFFDADGRLLSSQVTVRKEKGATSPRFPRPQVVTDPFLLEVDTLVKILGTLQERRRELLENWTHSGAANRTTTPHP